MSLHGTTNTLLLQGRYAAEPQGGGDSDGIADFDSNGEWRLEYRGDVIRVSVSGEYSIAML
jgi:hypothetical protein